MDVLNAIGTPRILTNNEQPQFAESNSKLQEFVKPTTASCPSTQYEIIELELKKYGYEPVQRFSFQRDENSRSECYIKSRSPYGFYIFILIDEDSLVSFSKNDLSIIENKKVTLVDIPESVKRGIYRNSNGDIIAECSEGICKLSHNPKSTEPIETTFTFVSPQSSSQIIPKGSVLAYPVVRMKEIRISPKLVLERTLEETMRMRKIAYDKAKEDIKKFVEIQSAVKIATENYIDKYNKVRNVLSKEIPQYTAEQNKFITNPPRTDLDLNKFRKNEAQLSLINDVYISYVASTHEFRGFAQELNEIGRNIAILNEKLDRFIISLSTKVEMPIL